MSERRAQPPCFSMDGPLGPLRFAVSPRTIDVPVPFWKRFTDFDVGLILGIAIGLIAGWLVPL